LRIPLLGINVGSKFLNQKVEMVDPASNGCFRLWLPFEGFQGFGSSG
jgi:hypothetical protein